MGFVPVYQADIHISLNHITINEVEMVYSLDENRENILIRINTKSYKLRSSATGYVDSNPFID